MKQDGRSKDRAEHAGEKGEAGQQDGGEVLDLSKQVGELAEKLKACEKFEELYFKKAAEFDNFRKRNDRHKAQIIKLANEDLLLEILPIVDNFERALAAPAENISSLHDGIELILKQLENLLEKAGLKRIKSVGEKFNPHYHHAIGVVEKQDAEEDLVVEENLPGYILFDKVVRPAMVKVSKRAHNPTTASENKPE
ncbi:MAG: nucleotide exchange factor GrpE [Candidatus Aureabacteria bacterium]|nr:nucleotide exchange factor GrpE [Candidatus Auribacterota bacterium]